MILEALTDHYGVLLKNKDVVIPPQGDSSARVSCAAIISKDGALVDIQDLRIQSDKKKLVSRDMLVPEQVKRSVNIHPNFMCDNAAYVFGLDTKEKPERALKTAEAFKDFHIQLLDDSKEDDLTSFCDFLKKWNPENVMDSEVIFRNREMLEEGGNIVFKIDGRPGYLHNNVAANKVWKDYQENFKGGAEQGQCLVTGEIGPIAILHPSIKGIYGGQSTGSSIVSFNLRSFESYQKTKKQGLNAPVGYKAAFAYTTVLNYLIRSEKNHLRIGDTTTVFWAENSSGGLEENIFAELLNYSPDKGNEVHVDSEALRLVKSLFNRARQGLPVIADLEKSINPDTRFYILGLAPNASRVSIRFWHAGKFGSILENLLQHQLDMEIQQKGNQFVWSN